MERFIPGLVLVTLMSLVAPADTAAAVKGVKATLRNLKVVDIVVERLGTEERQMGLSEETLRAELLEQLKAKLPRLVIAGGPRKDWIYLNVLLGYIETEGGERRGHYGWMYLEIWRWAVIEATKTSAFVPVWNRGKIFRGPLRELHRQVREGISDYVTELAVDYHAVGNR